MKEFRYVAYSSRGERRAGQLKANSPKDALHQIAHLGLTVSTLEPATAVPSPARGLLWRGVSKPWLAHFIRQLAMLCEAQVPIDLALKTMQAQQTGRREAEIIGRIVTELTGGRSLSHAVEQVLVGSGSPIGAMIRAGENAGNIGRGLMSASAHLEGELEIRDTVRSALIYPTILVLTACGAMAVIITVLVPALLPLFRDNGVRPPPILAALDAFAAALSTHSTTVGLAGMSGLALVGLLKRSGAAELAAARAWLAMPGIGPIIREKSTIMACRLMSSLVGSGVAIPDALALTAQAIANRAQRDELRNAAATVVEGTKLSDALKRMPRWQPSFATFAAIGERTGEIPRILGSLADITEVSLRRRVATLTSTVVPAITIAIGLIVGTIIVTIMQAILGINDLAIR